MENENKAKARPGAAVAVLVVVIVLQIVYASISFFVERKGVFSDEVWCYGLANSTDGPFIYAPDGLRINYIDENSVYRHFNEPVSGEVLRDYITVQPGERFDYAAVYHNQTLDCHPVLYYVILHTICSFFPNKFSLVFAFVPSMVFLCITQIFLYRLALLCLRSEKYALTVCIFFAAIPASLFTFIFIRMYSLLTALLVMNAFYTARLIYGGEVTFGKLLPVLITAFFAFNTQYSAIAFIGAMTVAVCVYLLIKKGVRLSAAYGTFMLGTLLLFVALFPAIYEHIFDNQSTGEKRYGLVTQMRAVIGYITKYTYGIKIYLMRSSRIYYVLAALVMICALTAPVIFLLRKSEKMQRFFAAVKSGAKNLRRYAAASSYVPVMIFTGLAGTVVFVDLSCDVANTLEGTVRYLMPCYPFVCLLTVLSLKLVAEHLPLIRRAALPVTAVLLTVSAVRANMFDRTPFTCDTFPTSVTEAADAFSGKKTIVIIPEQRFIMTNTCAYLYKSESAYYVAADDLKGAAEGLRGKYPDADYVWVEKDNYLLNERQRAQLVGKGIISDSQAEKFDLRSDLEADTEHELFPDSVRARFLDDETDVLTGADPDIEMMIEANGRLFYVLKVNDSLRV